VKTLFHCLVMSLLVLFVDASEQKSIEEVDQEIKRQMMNIDTQLVQPFNISNFPEKTPQELMAILSSNRLDIALRISSLDYLQQDVADLYKKERIELLRKTDDIFKNQMLALQKSMIQNNF
jgi:hypothetical protein